MHERKINKHTINFSTEDIESYVKSMYVKLLIERDHPEVLIKAEELAKQFIKSQNDKQA